MLTLDDILLTLGDIAQRGRSSHHELLPGPELFLVPGARHFVQMDEPEQVGRLILDIRRTTSDVQSHE